MSVSIVCTILWNLLLFYCVENVLVAMQAVFPISRSYSSVPSAPRLKLVSTPDLKSFFSVDDVKLPPWLDGM